MPRRFLPKFALHLAMALGLAVALGSLGATPAQQISAQQSQTQPTGASPTFSPASVQIAPILPEAQGWLSDLIRIDTTKPATNDPTAKDPGAKGPPSGELTAAKYVAQILQKENIPSELLEITPGNAVVIGRLQAGPLPNASTALLLVAHLNVAGVNKAKWSVDPFSGTVKDGYIYGRGVIDDKGMLAANLAAFVALKHSGVRLNRDVIFLADGDADPGSPAGIKALAGKYWDKIASGFALNEGGEVLLQDNKVQYVGIADGEKVPYNVRVTASGTPGAASIAGPDDPIIHLAAAIAKVAAIEQPPQLMTLTRRYFEQLAMAEDEDTGKWMRALETERFSLAVVRLAEMRPLWGAMLHDTITPTELQAAVASDVVPSEARAILHVELLPGNPMSSLVAAMEKAVNDPKVRFDVDIDAGVAAPESALDSSLYQSIARTVPQQFAGAVALPMLSPGATGSAELRLRNVQAYGLFPFPMTASEELRRDGDDERMPVTSFRTGVEFLYRTIYDFAATK